MGLLKSVDNVPGIDYYEYRDRDYYNKYKYRARLSLYGVRYTYWYKTPAEFLARLNGRGFYGLRPKDKQDILNNLPSLNKFIEFRSASKNQKNSTIRIEGNVVAIFSNDLDFLHSIEQIIPNNNIDYTEVQTSSYIGIKHFVKEPKRKFRVYLKSKRIESEKIIQLRDMLARTNGLYPSSALKFWSNNAIPNQYSWKYRYSSASHFIDYDDESTLSYLALILGDLLGSRYKLEKRPD